MGASERQLSIEDWPDNRHVSKDPFWSLRNIQVNDGLSLTLMHRFLAQARTNASPSQSVV